MRRRTRRSAWTNRSQQILSGAFISRKGFPLTAVGLAGLVVLSFWLGQNPPPSDPTPAESAPQTASVPDPTAAPTPVPRSAEPATPKPQRSVQDVEVPMTREEVDRTTAGKKAAEARRLAEEARAQALSRSPDQALDELDPSLLESREPDLRTRLETTELTPSQLDNAATIALDAGEVRTRSAAIQALGRSTEGRAQEILMQLFDDVEDHNERRFVMGYIRPQSLDDAAGQWLLGRLGDPHLAEEFKKQMIFSLVMVQTAQAGNNRQQALNQLLDKVPGEWRPEVLSTFRSILQE